MLLQYKKKNSWIYMYTAHIREAGWMLTIKYIHISYVPYHKLIPFTNDLSMQFSTLFKFVHSTDLWSISIAKTSSFIWLKISQFKMLSSQLYVRLIKIHVPIPQTIKIKNKNTRTNNHCYSWLKCTMLNSMSTQLRWSIYTECLAPKKSVSMLTAAAAAAAAAVHHCCLLVHF